MGPDVGVNSTIFARPKSLMLSRMVLCVGLFDSLLCAFAVFIELSA